MRANEAAIVSVKKPYVKPMLATHGSVQQLTEGGHKDGKPPGDLGSNIRFPVFGTKDEPFGGW